jgi:hypothetical protein
MPGRERFQSHVTYSYTRGLKIGLRRGNLAGCMSIYPASMQRYASERRQCVLLVIVLVVAGIAHGQRRGGRGPVPQPPANPPAFKDLIVTFQGVLKNSTRKEIIIELDENRQLMTFRRTKETKFTEGGVELKATAIDLESHVTVDAKQDTDTKFRAVAVRAGEEGKSQAK